MSRRRAPGQAPRHPFSLRRAAAHVGWAVFVSGVAPEPQPFDGAVRWWPWRFLLSLARCGLAAVIDCAASATLAGSMVPSSARNPATSGWAVHRSVGSTRWVGGESVRLRSGAAGGEVAFLGG